MKVELDRNGLKALVNGSEPYHSEFENILVKKAGFDYDEQTDISWWNTLEDLTDEELYEVYLICKNSWPSTEPIEVFKQTDDDWYPNFPNDTVKLTYRGLINGYRKNIEKYVWRVSCWGNDDFGIIKDFKSSEEALACFNELNERTKINHEDLFRMGFEMF